MSSCPNSNGKAGLSAPFLRRVVLPRAEPSGRNHVTLDKVLAFSRVTIDELKKLAKLDEMVVGNAGTPVLSRLRTRCGRLLEGSNQVRRMDSKLLRSSPRGAGSEGLSAVGAGNVSGQ